MNYQKKWLSKANLAWLGFVVLITTHFYVVLSSSINIPYSDDFHQQLHTAINIDKDGELISVLFRQHGVHRIFTTHFPTYLEHLLTGEINLKNQLIVGIILLCALVLVVASFSSEKNRSIVLTIAALILLSPTSSSTWVGGTIPYFALLLFGLLSIKWLDQISKPLYLIGSLTFMLLSVFSMIGGLVLPIIGVAFLAQQKKLRTVSGRIWLAIAIVSFIAYFNGFVNRDSQTSIFHFLSNPEFAFEFTFRVLGNFLSDLVSFDLLAYLSFIIIVLFFTLVCKNTSTNGIVLTPIGLAFIFVLMVVGSVIAGRLGLEEDMVAYGPRYYVLTKTLWILGLIILMEKKLLSNSVIVFIFGFSTLYCLATYQKKTVDLALYQQRQSNAMVDHLIRESSSGFVFGATPDVAGKIVSHAIDQGIYTPELLTTPSRQVKYLKYSDFIDGLDVNLVRDNKTGRYRYLAFEVDTPTSVHEVAIVPRGIYGPATLLKAAEKIAPARLVVSDIERAKNPSDVYEVIIDVSNYDASLTYDILVISLGRITAIATL